MSFREDGSLKLDASHCTADGGAAEIQAALEVLAEMLGADWREEKHILGAKMHHSHGAGVGADHHVRIK